MTYLTVLALHLALVVTTGLVGLVAVFAALRGSVRLCKRVAVFLAVIATLEVITGVLLAIISPTVEAASLGSHIALYLGVCVALEVALYVRIKRFALYAESFE